MDMTLFLLLLFFGTALQSVDATESASSCGRNLEPLASEVIDLLSKSNSITIDDLTCAEVSDINKLDPEDIFVTTGRENNSINICISDNRLDPCKIKIGNIISGKNPNDVLTEVFGIRREIDLSKPIEESIERLFIKPSGEIIPSKSRQ
ncbi:COP23 domain-containing protein [Synechococcus sp. AH-551-E02]|nr:hypothetical protein [Synechococcus sp. AH-551-E02]MDB4653632.1 COP23 domain-containing protein [Synechococcus sp. AH-551-E02]